MVSSSAMVSETSERAAQTDRVLVIFPGALGDLICLGPALRALARRHHEATLELMAREELARFAVHRLGIVHDGIVRGGITQAHSQPYSRSHSIDRREVAALFAEAPDLTAATQFFRPFARIYS